MSETNINTLLQRIIDNRVSLLEFAQRGYASGRGLIIVHHESGFTPMFRWLSREPASLLIAQWHAPDEVLQLVDEYDAESQFVVFVMHAVGADDDGFTNCYGAIIDIDGIKSR